MNIIQKQPNTSGAYPPVQENWDEPVPDTHYEITCDYSEFYNGFIIPKIENDVVTSFACNTELRNAWKLEQSEKPIPAPEPTNDDIINALVDCEYRLTLLEV